MDSAQKTKTIGLIKKILSITGKVLDALLVIVLLTILIYNIFCIVESKKGVAFPMLCGIGAAVVNSGSMSPTIEKDDMIIVAKDSSGYSVGDIVTFVDENDTLITHRIVAVNEDGTFKTKGDYAQNTEDDYKLSDERIFGKVVLTIHGYAKIQEFFHKPIGIFVFVVIVLLVLFAPYIVKTIIKLIKNAKTNSSNK